MYELTVLTLKCLVSIFATVKAPFVNKLIDMSVYVANSGLSVVFIKSVYQFKYLIKKK